MKVINLPRRSGKTKKIISYLRDNKNKAILLCVNLNFKKRIVEKYPDVADRVFTYNQYRSNQHRGLICKEIIIDNVDILLYHIFNMEVSLVSITE